MEQSDPKGEISLDWLIRLRWGAVAGEGAAIAVAQAIFGGLPVLRLFAFVAVLVFSNLLLRARGIRALSPRSVCGIVLSLDILLLSGLLLATGGAYNPFSILYLVYISLAAVVLGPRWTWFLAALSILCHGLLFTGEMGHVEHSGTELLMHLQGMWIAFCVAAILTAYFVVKLSTAVERRDATMAEMRERVARQERLAAVTTLAAGAAHELGTPLATIAVASKELERAIRALPEPHAEVLAGDAALIRSELERCRAILNRLAADAGQQPGEAPVPMEVEEVVAELPEPSSKCFRGGGGSGRLLPRRRRRGPADGGPGLGTGNGPRCPGPCGRALLLDQGSRLGPGSGGLHRPHPQRANGRTAAARVQPRAGHDGDGRDRGPRRGRGPCRLTRPSRAAS
jgi:two-component system sensor histidine kinase RegB